jgi:hypothetical protein
MPKETRMAAAAGKAPKALPKIPARLTITSMFGVYHVAAERSNIESMRALEVRIGGLRRFPAEKGAVARGIVPAYIMRGP